MTAETCALTDPGAIGAEPVNLIIFVLIGLLGGAHCLGMCGPVVTTYSQQMQPDSRSGMVTLRVVKQHGLFNLGRTLSYAILGGLFGLAGSLAFVTGRHVTLLTTDIHALTGIGIGLLIIGIGIQYATRGSAKGLTIPGLGWLFASVHTFVQPRITRWVQDSRILGLGALHGFLPCPLLYPAFLYAFVQGSAVGGIVALGLLGLGTIPAVFFVGTLTGSIGLAHRRRLHILLGLVFIVLGYIPLQHGLAVLGIPLPHPPIPSFQPL